MLKYLSLLFALGACALGASIPNGLLPQLDGRIVGGQATVISKYPWQVSLQRSGSHSCGGSIIRPQVVVTAAHCLQNSVSVSILKVRAGTSYWSSGGVLLQVEEYLNHEDYNGETMVNDIALIKLASPLFYSSTIKSINLAKTAPAHGTSAVVTGWGTTSSGGGSLPLQLQEVAVDIVGKTECASSAYNYGPDIKSTMICAGTMGKDACQGDSGGPLVANGELVGIVSWGYGCAFENYPGVYASAAELESWVSAKLE